MSENLSTVADRLLTTRVSPAAATALTADFNRHPGPKHGLVVGAGDHGEAVVGRQRVDGRREHR